MEAISTQPMKCLHCGTDLDRLTKLRGASEYCSEDCRRAAEEEFNQLAISRLTRLRPARAAVRSQLGEVREVRSGGETLTVVNYRPGAACALVTEPPEAGFLLEVAITAPGLEKQSPEPLAPQPGDPALPRTAAPPAGGLESLRALHLALRTRLRPAPRPGRALNAFCVSWIAPGEPVVEAVAFAGPEPVWPDRLGVELPLLGIEDMVRPDSPPPAPLLPPVQHAAIPSKRGPRPEPECRFAPAVGTPSLPAPVLSAPRLRIHLPRPSLQPFRPRYTFAAAPAAAVSGPEPAVEPPATEPEAAMVVDAPSFGIAAAPSRRDRWAIGRIAAAVAVAAAIAGGVWAWNSRASSRPRTETAPSASAKPALDPAHWRTFPAGDATGIARGRTLIAFEPSRQRQDYRLEAAARIEQRALGLVFRLRDPLNYYCWKVELSPGGSAGTARVIQFAVVEGREQPHRVTPLRVPVAPDVRIHVDVRGPVFTLQMNGVAVDTFTDSRISSGAAGFANESGERAVIKTARVTD